ncbi:MAG: methyltransferase [Candidatus Aenigmarchaeota archaeon]|nr:methyltransferase [Candidatus Aenigmarchaeota archaeon]
MTLSKKQLAILLSQLDSNPSPDPNLEQYEIPGELAAEIINLAFLSGDIEDKTVLDLGCGSGRLAIGSALMGAKEVTGVDIDKDVLETAKKNAKKVKEISDERIEFIHSDTIDWKGKVDTVIQNPPFGIQKEHADRIFLEKALECGNKIYSLHRSYSKSRNFLTKYIRKHGGEIEKIIKYQFRMPHTFKFHEKPAVTFDVDLYIVRSNS